ncbi:MAG: serine/threonine protein kinase [Planctomycetia bacterium]|nr:serine/threonine protein kinase [Planctomycetia bacterium]
MSTDPVQMVKELLLQAGAGERSLAALHGYEFVRELGRGGMGAVCLVRHSSRGEMAALKIMLPDIETDEHARTTFLREVENTRALNHPNVVRFFASGSSGNVFFFTMEYCDGGSVQGLMKQMGGRLARNETGAIILQVLDGLIYAHSADIPHVLLADGSSRPGKGLVHRDIKPLNVFLSGSGAVAKLGDYGLSKAFGLAGLTGHTEPRTVAGSPPFMPRQQLDNYRFAKPEVDVWAVAASCYCMLTGRAPRDFPADEDPWDVVWQRDPVPIRRREPSIPAPLADLLDLALDDRSDLHFQSAAEFKQALQSVLA